jgi:hypothetical protein
LTGPGQTCAHEPAQFSATRHIIDVSSLFWTFFAFMLLQPLFTARWYTVRRAQAIRSVSPSCGRTSTISLSRRPLTRLTQMRNADRLAEQEQELARLLKLRKSLLSNVSWNSQVKVLS